MTTIAAIARACGVGKATVSRALAGRPAVAAATRARILAEAERVGWRPDPQLARLARRRWPRGRRADAAPLALLLQSRSAAPPLAREWQQAARELGYRLVHLDPRREGDVAGRLDAMGIRGVLLLMVEDDVPLDLPWHRLAVLAIDFARADLAVHRVARDWPRLLAQGTRIALERGYRRVGLVQLRHASASTNRVMEDAVALALRDLRRQAGPQPRPYWGPPAPDDDAFARWLARERPDVLVARFESQWHRLRGLGLRCPRDIGYLALQPPLDPRAAPIDHLDVWTPAARRLAMAELHRLVVDAAWGFPAQPMHLLLPALHRPGGSLRGG